MLTGGSFRTFTPTIEALVLGEEFQIKHKLVVFRPPDEPVNWITVSATTPTLDEKVIAEIKRLLPDVKELRMRLASEKLIMEAIDEVFHPSMEFKVWLKEPARKALEEKAKAEGVSVETLLEKLADKVVEEEKDQEDSESQ